RPQGLAQLNVLIWRQKIRPHFRALYVHCQVLDRLLLLAFLGLYQFLFELADPCAHQLWLIGIFAKILGDITSVQMKPKCDQVFVKWMRDRQSHQEQSSESDHIFPIWS